MTLLNMTEEELARVAELRQIGFEVVGCGLLTNQTLKSPICYWRYMRGNRVSQLHPYPEAAWRDAIREWDLANRHITANPGVYRVSTNPSPKAFQPLVGKECASVTLEGMRKALELAGYTFSEVSWWKASGGMNTMSTGANEVIKDAWRDCLSNGISETNLASVARGCGMDAAYVKSMLRPPVWEGNVQPPIDTKLWVTPHNTIWGFRLLGTYLCQVLAYRGEYVWLLLLSDLGEETQNGANNYVTTRTDKVDFKVWKGNSSET